MADYKINLDRKVLKLLGSQLYGDVPSVIAELVANSYDAYAKNVWITIDLLNNIIIIEDDGNGMTDEEINTHFLNIGYDKRELNDSSNSTRAIMGRKGIGKLAAFSLTNYVKVLSCKEGETAGCLLDFEKITIYNEEPKEIEKEQIEFETSKLSNRSSGTRLELIDIKKRITTSYRYIVNRLIRTFDVNDEEFSIHIRKNNTEYKTLHRSELNYFSIMDTIVVIGKEFYDKREEVIKNKKPNDLKYTFTYNELLDQKSNTRKTNLKKFPYKIQVEDKNGNLVNSNFEIKGWIGTVDKLTNLRELGDNLVSHDENDGQKVTINDNRISLFSRNKLGEYDILSKIKVNTNREAYVIGELFVDVFEDNLLADMAISNRRGYEEQDNRYKEVIRIAKILLNFVVRYKNIISKKEKSIKNNEEFQKYKMTFLESKPKTQKILLDKLNPNEIKTVYEENFQFHRAVNNYSNNTRKILISHSRQYRLYGDFIIKIFENMGVNVSSTFIYTSDNRMTAPNNIEVFSYLQDCFREDIYVIYILSKYFFDSVPCILESGAAWATNKNYSNLLVDINKKDIEKPINNPDKTLYIGDIVNIDINDMQDFIKIVLNKINFSIPNDIIIEKAIKDAIIDLSPRVHKLQHYYPLRKYQAHPLCDHEECSYPMELDYDDKGKVIYKCKNPLCPTNKNVSIY